jgi:2-keto-4-pentenoate hydratase/2-oxohepta-3-ene-1,7-dioic acid hydratase in catechol pathway
MRLISFSTAEGPRVGVRADGRVVDLHAVDPGLPTDMAAFLARGDEALDAARKAAASADGGLAPEDVKLLPVVPRPPKILCVARNYGAHAREAGLDVLEQPNIFIRFAQSLIADGEPIQVPRVSRQVDWEAELVTSDEIPDPGNLKLELAVNGETRQSGSTSEMIFSVEELIAFISTFTTLEPGDVIATGTPSGVGHFHDPPTYLKAGDTVRIEIERVGVQVNPVIDEPAS